MAHSYVFFREIADFIKRRSGLVPEIGLVLGTGLGPLAAGIEDPVVLPYGEIPGFLTATAPSHAGELILGTLGGRNVVCMSGRFHTYEGYDFEELALPIRVLHLLGVKAAILTNAAGAVNTDYRPGDVVVLRDQIKLTGPSPLRGPNAEEFGPRFFDTTRMYTPALRKLALECGADSGLRFHEGVYMFFTGPQFETPAEIRAARILGADVVGMSTAPEALAAAHCGMPLLGLSVVTNMAAGVLDRPLSGAEVDETAGAIEAPLSAYVKKLVSAI